MKCYASNDYSKIAIGFFIVNQITTTVCYINRNGYDGALEISDLSTLPENVFINESYRKRVNLNGNNFTTLPENIFKNLTVLEYLNLDGNQLSTLHENTFKNLTKLSWLSVGINQLSTLQEKTFNSLTELTSLYLNRNQLSTLHENTFESLIKLRWLDLSGNQLSTLHENIFNGLTELGWLNLTGNQLSTLHVNTFNSLTKLWRLYLTGNKLSTLHENTFNGLTELNLLQLTGNQLSTLHEHTFASLNELLDLDLSENPWLCECKFLEIFRSHAKQVAHYDIVCGDGERPMDKLARSITWNIVCPYECICLFPSSTTSMLFDCSSRNLNGVPSKLGNVFHQMPSLQKIELNIENNNIINLPNRTMQGFELFTKITARNNSINFINVDNLPQNLTEIDLSENELRSLNDAVIQHIGDMKMLRRLVLGRNPWGCDDKFFEFIRLNLDKVDYKCILCNDGEPLFVKLNRLTFWITNDTRDGVRPDVADSNEIIRKISHKEALGNICPSECECFIKEMNTSVQYRCPENDLRNAIPHYESGKKDWPIIRPDAETDAESKC